jgi:SAM-dependent methyltransferase
MNHQSTTRFSNRASDYARYRPQYPESLVEALCTSLGLAPGSVVADIGSGTGISVGYLLDLGCTVFAVEPNEEMRRAAEERFAAHPRFRSVQGTAEATTLPDASADAVTAAQAFHWFDPARTRLEWRRILRPDGRVAVFWNSRRTSTPFLREYERLLHTFAIDYQEVKNEWTAAERLQTFFAGASEAHVFSNLQRLDVESLGGLLRSASYTPPPGHPRHEPMMRQLEALFAAHQRDGFVTMEYDTKLLVGRLSR